MCPQLSWIEQRPSKPWVGGSNPFGHIFFWDKSWKSYGGYSAVGQRARLWLWRPRVRIPVSTLQLGSATSKRQWLLTFLFYRKILGYRQAVRHRTLTPALRWFESNQPSLRQKYIHKCTSIFLITPRTITRDQSSTRFFL